MKTALTICSLVIILLTGCTQSTPFPEEALTASKIYFKPTFGESIELSREQALLVKEIARRFKDKGQVQIDTETLPAGDGVFILGQTHFGWLGESLYFDRTNSSHRLIVNDSHLGKMYMALTNFQSQGLTASTITATQWKHILDQLK
jgi:hypothetical protein